MPEKEPIDIVVQEEPAQTGGVLDVNAPDFDADRAIKIAEKRIQFLNKVKLATLKMTRPADWVRHRQGDKVNYYLEAAGAEKVAPLWGIEYSEVRADNLEKDESKPPIIEVWGYIYSQVLNLKQQIVGGRSGQDDFYVKQSGKTDILDVRKAAVSNWYARAIQILLGMRRVTKEDLEAAGIDTSKCSGFNFKEGAKAAHSKTMQAEWTDELTELRTKVGTMIMEIAGGDKKHAEDLLEEFTSFTDKKTGEFVKGKRSLKAVSPRAIQAVYGRAKERYEIEFPDHKKGDSL